MVLTGTSLLLLHSDGQRDVLLVLANTKAGLEHAVERLATGNLDDCLVRETTTPTPTVLALCPTGEVAEGKGGGGWQAPEPPALPTPKPPVTDTKTVTGTVTPPTPEPPAEPEGRIMVIAFDQGEGQYEGITSLDDYVAVLQARYEVTAWSIAELGPPDRTDILGHDLVIWTFGDFDAEAAMEEMTDVLIAVVLGEIPFIMSGAFVGDAGNVAVQRDIQVSDASHPIAEGFGDGEVIPFVASPSGVEYEISVLEDTQAEDGDVVFVRGPDSDEVGVPAVATAEDPASGLRIGLIGFPIYLLPEEAKSRLVLNMVGWLLNP